MEKLVSTLITTFTGSLFLLFTGTLTAQCETWEGSSKKDDALNAHSIYRQAIKIEDYTVAFENWKQAYEVAPAADGKRDYHFTDGALLYKQKFETTSDDSKKLKYADMANSLIEKAIGCLESGAIEVKCPGSDCVEKRVGYLLGRKAFDMFYTFRSPYRDIAETLKRSVELSGNDAEYIIFVPYAEVVVYMYTNELMSKEEARKIYDELNAIADFNIANNQRFKAYYDQAKSAMNGTFVYIERQIFDCDFFEKKLRPAYEMDADNPEVIKDILSNLKAQGCTDGDPLHDELAEKWKKYAEEENARLQAEFEERNPQIVAKRLYDEGNFQGAIEKYREAIAKETDPERKSSYLFSKASIEFRRLDQLGNARKTALEAAALNPNWGRPYMLIGDMYASSARNCGDSWNQRLAILAAMDKYIQAKSIDSEVAEEANDKLSRYRASMPSQDEGFMRGLKEGQTVDVGCWIGEKVKVRYN